MRALFTTYEGGGHVPAALMVAAELRRRGDEVLLLSDEATRGAASAAGVAFQPWRRAPSRRVAGAATDPLEDWRAVTPSGVVRSICKAVISGPSKRYAEDCLDAIDAFRPDLVVSQELLFGSMMAAEARGVPLVLLTGNLWCFPTRLDVPPFGPAFAPARGPMGEERDRWTREYIAGLYDGGLEDLNEARRALGLAPLRRALDQLRAARRVLIGASRAFDIGDRTPPEPFDYVGPLIQVPDWAASPLPAGSSGSRPQVLVSFSTTFQNQAKVLSRCVRALSKLPVEGVVTLGPALHPGDVPAADNVRVVQAASHDALLPHCAAMICHGGHGTVIRPLMLGVPVLCMPMGRDQPENAVRIVSQGAGISRAAWSGPGRIRRALKRLLDTPAYAENAARLGAAVKQEADGGRRAADLLRLIGRAAPDLGQDLEWDLGQHPPAGPAASGVERSGRLQDALFESRAQLARSR